MKRWLGVDFRSARCRAIASRPTRRSLSHSRVHAERYRVDALLAREDAVQDVEVNGWIRSVRRQKRVTFVALGDGSSHEPLQAVLSPEQSAGYYLEDEFRQQYRANHTADWLMALQWL